MDVIKALSLAGLILVIMISCMLIFVFSFNRAPESVFYTTIAMLLMLIPETALLFMYVNFTPANAFLGAFIRKDKLDAHFGEDRYFRIKATKGIGGMAEIKNQGMYLSRPEDTYIEAKSKLPISIHYGKTSLSLQPKFAAVAKKLDQMGITNYQDLKLYYDILNKQKKYLEDYRTQQAIIAKGGELQKDKDGKELRLPPVPANQLLPDHIQIVGESINMAEVVKYFSSTERSDVIESEIQRRTAAEVMNRLKGNGEMIKWAVFIMIILIGAAIAYFIIVQNSGGGGGTSIINNFYNTTAQGLINNTPSITTNPSLNVTGPGVSVR